MQILDLKLLNFRNYKTLNLKFSNHLNLIVGKNGMGKTNLIEAIYVLALTKSFRTNNDKLLILKNEELFKIEANIFDSIENNFKLILNNEGKNAKINSTKIAKLSDYISKISVILFNPDDLNIIKDSPNIRRKKLNMDLSELNNVYLKKLNNYIKVLKQRNSYLKTIYVNAQASKEYLNILTNELINIGQDIYEIRKKFLEKINTKIDDFYFKITGLKGLKIKYFSDFDKDKEFLIKKFSQYENKDIIFGKTQLGIQRDDYAFYLESDNLKDYGSEGQQKNAIIAYKMSEIDIFYEEKETYPILILDDLFSELDQEKVTNILNILNKEIQTFITTTEIDRINQDLLKNSKIIRVIDGQIEEIDYEG